MTTSPSISPLPLELKSLILSFCDQDTLAKTARVSFAFLELSSPFLYEDVVVHGIDKLQKLFCERKRSSLPQLHPYLALSQMKRLSFTLRSGEGDKRGLFLHFPYLPTDRLFEHPYSSISFQPHPLRSLSVYLPNEVGSTFISPGHFLEIFDPTCFRLVGALPKGPRPTFDGQLNELVQLNAMLFDWPSLTHLILKNAIFYRRLADTIEPSTRTFTTSFDMTALDMGSAARAQALDELAEINLGGDRQSMFAMAWLRSVEVLVSSEIAREEVWKVMKEEAESDIGLAAWEEMKPFISVVVVPRNKCEQSFGL